MRQSTADAERRGLPLEAMIAAAHDRSMTRTSSFILFALLFAAALVVVLQAGAQTTPDNEIQKVLSWLPPDTETVVVADARKRSFLDLEMFSKHHDDQEEEGRPVSVQDVAARFQYLPMGFLGIKGGFLVDLFRNHPLALTIEGSRHFRGPRGGLGMMDYEGCEIAISKNNMRRDGESLLSRNKAMATKQEEIDGHTATVFEEDWEAIWTFQVIFPQPDVLMVCSNRDYAQEVLKRMRQSALDRALPPTLPEWNYVNTDAPFWGMRHFDRAQAELDPTSPFGGRKAANIPDEQGIGLVFSFGPERSNATTITYLSDDRNISEKLKNYERSRHDETGDDFHLNLTQLKPGILQFSCPISTHGQLLDFFFILEGVLGHAIYV
jgi:hypothetical protein